MATNVLGCIWFIFTSNLISLPAVRILGYMRVQFEISKSAKIYILLERKKTEHFYTILAGKKSLQFPFPSFLPPHLSFKLKRNERKKEKTSVKINKRIVNRFVPYSGTCLTCKSGLCLQNWYFMNNTRNMADVVLLRTPRSCDWNL